ncbi:MAG: HlyD family efflux transporter periplasmic adaptor subunit [Desulfobacterales bacterium]|nr:HlyD family efflux transporter periplasmic adaptor subunit [Desulfobacterales bacterium]
MYNINMLKGAGRFVSVVAVLGAILLPVCLRAGEVSVDGTTASRASEIILTGKVFCSLKRQVVLPFHGVVLSLQVRPGQQVKKGDVLVRYRLDPGEVRKLSLRYSDLKLLELEVRLLEMETKIADLGDRERELALLAQKELAPARSREHAAMQLRVLRERRKLLQKQLHWERQLKNKERKLIEEQLGRSINGHISGEAVLLSPMDGHIISIHPEVRAGAELKSGTPAVQVGVMEPMLIRARVHEIESTRLSPGDLAEFSLESIPGRMFEARINSISWTSTSMRLDQPSYYEVEFVLPNPELVLKEGLKGRLVLRPHR